MDQEIVDKNNFYQKPIYIARFQDKFYCPFPINCNPYLGCAHNCSYCYARVLQEVKHIWRPIRPASIEVFRKEMLGAMSGKLNSPLHKLIRARVPIRFATMTDGFQPCERELQITRQMFELFAQLQYPVVIGTKGDIILDRPYIDLLKQFPSVVQVTITTDDDLLAKQIEPGAPTATRRIEVLRDLTREGIVAQLRIAPLMPLINDLPASLVKKAVDAGVKDILTQWIKFGGSKLSKQHLNDALGFDYEARLQASQIPLRRSGSAIAPTVETMTRYNAALKALIPEGVNFYPTPDPKGAIIGRACCCGLDNYAGFESLLRSAFRMNKRRIRWHTTFDQFMYGHTIPPFVKAYKEAWDAGAFANDLLEEFVFHEEDNTYSRKDLYEAVQSGQISVQDLKT